MVEAITGHSNVIEALRQYARKYAASCAGRQKDAAEKTDGEVLPRGQSHKDEDEEIGNLPITSQSARAVESGVSPRQQRKLDRLARDRMDLLDRVRAGTLSVNAAFIKAGWTKRASPALGLDNRRDAIPSGVGQAFPRGGDEPESGVVLEQKRQAIRRDTVMVVRAFRRNRFVCSSYVQSCGVRTSIVQTVAWGRIEPITSRPRINRVRRKLTGRNMSNSSKAVAATGSTKPAKVRSAVQGIGGRASGCVSAASSRGDRAMRSPASERIET